MELHFYILNDTTIPSNPVNNFFFIPAIHFNHYKNILINISKNHNIHIWSTNNKQKNHLENIFEKYDKIFVKKIDINNKNDLFDFILVNNEQTGLTKYTYKISPFFINICVFIIIFFISWLLCLLTQITKNIDIILMFAISLFAAGLYYIYQLFLENKLRDVFFSSIIKII
jgi:hypothetical protein